MPTVSSHSTDKSPPAQFFTVRPTLDPKVLLRVDRRSGRALLLYPECGLELTHTAEAIVRFCTGAYEVRHIIASLVDRYGAEQRQAIEHDVCVFLHLLMDRGLLYAR
jgi:coenzyme PQQ biosynthesis protein PqqD